MMPLVVSVALGLVLCYFVCGIPFGLVIARTHGVDVRQVGSRNIGTTNVARSVGAGAAAGTLLGDALKGYVCIMLARLCIAQSTALGGDFALTQPQAAYGWIASLFFFSCVCGHVFSPYLHCHGGKGIAVGLGAGLGLSWALGLLILAVFIVVAVPSRYVSAGSVAAAISLPLWAMVLGFAPATLPAIAATAAVVLWSHRSNISNLMQGKERKFSIHRAGDPVERASDSPSEPTEQQDDADEMNRAANSASSGAANSASGGAANSGVNSASNRTANRVAKERDVS